jgi:DNA-binding MarR family transcriptional regulator
MALDDFARAVYTLSAADARLRGRATRVPGALSFPHARALRVLAELGPLTITQLSAHTETSGAAVTQLVNGLVTAGYVTRSRTDEDRRSVVVSITPQGLERHSARQALLAEAFEATLGHLGTAQIVATADVLRALAALYDEL